MSASIFRLESRTSGRSSASASLASIRARSTPSRSTRAESFSTGQAGSPSRSTHCFSAALIFFNWAFNCALIWVTVSSKPVSDCSMTARTRAASPSVMAIVAQWAATASST
ncbi:hypothetical protein [Glycomyces tarimensis]